MSESEMVRIRVDSIFRSVNHSRDGESSSPRSASAAIEQRSSIESSLSSILEPRDRVSSVLGPRRDRRRAYHNLAEIRSCKHLTCEN